MGWSGNPQLKSLRKIVLNMSRRQKRCVLLAVDLIFIPVSILLVAITQTPHLPQAAAISDAIVPVAALMAIGAVLSVQLGIPRIKLSTYEAHEVGKTGLFAFFLTISAISVGHLSGHAFHFGAYLVFGLMYFLLSVLARLAMLQLMLAVYRLSNPTCRVLIYGAGKTGMQLASALRIHAAIDPIAFVDDNPTLHGMTVAGLPVLDPGRIAAIAAERRIDRVLLAIPSASSPTRRAIAQRLQAAGLDVQTLPSFAQLIGKEAPLVEQLEPVQMDRFLGRPERGAVGDADYSVYTGKSVLISGAGGSIGSELCRQIVTARPARLVLFELSEHALYTIEMELREVAQDLGVELVPLLGSVQDDALVRQTLQKQAVEMVIHAAAYKHVPMIELNPLQGLSNNVLGTAVLARAAVAAGVERFVLVSSDKAVRPSNVMGASKFLAEQIVRDLALRGPATLFSVVRFGNVLGSSGSVVPLFQEQIRRGGPVTVTHPDVTRYFMTIEEASHLVLTAGAMAHGGEIFVLDMGEPVEVRALARQVIEAAGLSVRDAANPDGDIAIEIIGLRPGEKLHEELTLSTYLTTTAHEKIYSVNEPHLSEIEVASALRSLREAAVSYDEDFALSVMSRWVEDYTPASVVQLTS